MSDGPGRVSAPRATGYRVLMVAPTSFFADYGCHVRILEETRALQRLGCRVTICTYHNGKDVAGIDIRRTMAIPWRHGYEVGSSRHKIAFDLLLFLRTLTAMAQVRPDVVHAHLHEGALIAGLLARAWRVPMVFDFQGSLAAEMTDHGFLSAGSRLYAPLRRLETAIDRNAPHILTSSANAARLLAGEFGVPDRRISCVPDAVSTEAFQPAARDGAWASLRRAWGIPAGRTVVVYLGLLAEYQGTGLLLEAARVLCQSRQDLHFVVAGFPHVEEYMQRAQALGLGPYITFTGQVPYEDAPRILSLGDIAVAPKTSRTEGAGKLLNYMAMALPTVAFDTPVSREYLGEHGAYAAAGDAVDLARAIAALADAPERRAALGAALRQRAEACFTWEASAGLILDIYGQMLAARR